MDDIQLTTETKEILVKTDEERIEYISKTYWIDYPIALNILQKMEDFYTETL